MKRLLLIAVCMVMVLSFAACTMQSPVSEGEPKASNEPAGETQTTAGEGAYKIGVSMFDLSDPYFVAIANGVKAAAADLGVELTMDDPAADTQKQVSALENFITSGVDGIIVSAVEPESINNILKEAQSKGIKVLAQNHPVEFYDVFVTIIEYDYGYAGGVVCGEWINETFPNQEVEVGVIGAGLHTTGVDRTKGMVEGLAATAPLAKVVSEQDGEGLTEKAMNVAENMLQANPNIVAIMCFDDLAALGAYEAVKANKSEAESKKFGVFGLDAVDQALEAIASGGAYKGTVDIAPFDTGYKALELCVKAIKGEDVPKQVLQDMVPVTAKNISNYVK